MVLETISYTAPSLPPFGLARAILIEIFVMVLVKVQLFGLRPLLKSSNNTMSGEGVVGGESGTGNGEVGAIVVLDGDGETLV